MSSRTPPLRVELQPSRLQAALLCGLWLAATCAAVLSAHPPLLAASLWLAVSGCLLHAWRAERRGGVRALCLHADGRLHVGHADGRTQDGQLDGYAVLGTVALFLYVRQPGARGGCLRLALLRDACAADAFRRLRARLRLGG